MYCKSCGTKIEEDANFCPMCGIEQKKSKSKKEEKDITEKIEEKINLKVKKKNHYLTITVILIILSIIAISLIPIEGTVSKNVPYQEAVYKTVEKTIYVDKTETRYKSEIITKYRTVYYGTLKNTAGFWSKVTGGSDEIWTFDNALSWKKEGGNIDYKFIITNIDGTENYYYNIDWWNINQKQMPYTETVDTPYEITVSVPQTVSEQVIDRYETRYKKENIKETNPLIVWAFEYIKTYLSLNR